MSCRHNPLSPPPTSLILTATAQSGQNLEKTKAGLEVERNICGRLLQEESKKEGAVAFHVYQAYWRAVGQGLALAILLSLLLMQGWSEPQSPSSQHSQGPHHSHLFVRILTKP